MAEVWPFEPQGLDVSLEWLTSVLSSYTQEQRSKLRQQYPRAIFNMRFYLQQGETFLARRITERALNEYLVPDWRYAEIVKTTFDGSNLVLPVSDASFYGEVGDKAIAWVSPSEYFQFDISARGVNTLTASAGPATAMSRFFLMPLLTCFTRDGMKIVHGTNNFNEARAQFETRVYKDLTSFAPSFPTYLGYQVVTDRDIFVGSHDAEIVKIVSIVDSNTGKVDLEGLYDHVDMMSTVSADDYGSENLIQREGWIHQRAGRLVPFWKPSWGSDILLTAGASAGATTLTAQATAPAADFIDRHFCVSQGETFTFFEVSNAVAAGSSITLTLSAGLSDAIVLADVQTVSEMNLWRLDADDVKISYSPGVRGSISIPLVGLDNEL